MQFQSQVYTEYTVNKGVYKESSWGAPEGIRSPDTNLSQLWSTVQCGCLCVELREEAESKKAPLEGGLGGEP